MSEFLAEARILVRPDTSRFRRELEAQLQSVVARPIKIPVVPVVGAGFAAAAATTTALTVAQEQAAASTVITSDALATATTISRQYAGAVDLATVATASLAEAQTAEAAAAKAAAAAQAAQARTISGVAKGAAASGLTLFGLRGATLAASGAFLAGTAAVVGFGKALQSAASLETELNVFKVTAGATADEMDRVSESAKQLGRDITLPGITAGDAAEAMTELAKAGLDVQDSLAGARGALQLATAAQIDVKDSTNLVAGALNAFQLAGADAVKVADLLTGAAKESQGEITDMGTALSQAAAVAQQFGVSIDDTVTLLTELAQAGLSGGRAGTSLRVAFLRLVNPPKDAAKALEELNVQIRDAQGNLRPQIFTDIADAISGYTKAQQDATLATIFGSDAIRAAAIIGNKGSASFLSIRDAVTEAGLAQESAAARTSGLEGAYENLSNQVGALGLTFGEAAKGPVTAFVKSLAATVEQVNAAAEATLNLAKKELELEKAVVDLIPFADKLGLSFGKIAKFGTFLNPLTGQLAILGEAQRRFGSDTEDTEKKTDEYGNTIDGVTKSVEGLSRALLQSAADSKINTEAITANVSALLQSAADSRIDFSKLGQTSAPKRNILDPKEIQNIIGGFDAQEVRAKIAGDNAQLLRVLNAEQDFLERQLQRDFVKRRPALQRLIEQSLLGVVTDISGIQARAQAENNALKSAAERLAADRAKAVADAAKKIRDAAVAAAKKAADLAEAQRRLREQQHADLLRGFDLDISLDQIQGNQAKEIQDRNRKIAQLNKDLAAEAKLHGKSTVLYKEIRNEIAAQNAAKKQIQGEAQKGQSFAAATFDFLRTQQGFASSLLGNLIPTGATGGLVGGQSPVQQALNPQASFADGQSKTGPTSGQAQTTNGLLGAILNQLKTLNGDNVAPEATRQNRGQRSVMDGVGGG